MPRERIYSYQHNSLPGQPPPPETFSVEVGWARDHGSVEVAATVSDGTARIVRIVNDWLTEAGYEPIDLAALQAKLKGAAAFDGYHVHLENRSDVNRLIRALKRARDGAFGRDE